MCKMLFIGTQNELQEIPFDTNKIDFHLEKISGEFLPIKHTFSHQNIYFVGTSRGCSCDFGIQSNKCDPISIKRTIPLQNLLNKYRKISGTYDEWEKLHQKKVANAIEKQANYLTQTLKLIDTIISETKKGNTVEMFCVWTGDYIATPEFNDTIDTTKVDLGENFEIAEKEFTIFV